MQQVTKHQHVVYEANAGLVSAIVRIAHKDGTSTIEARFFLDAMGNPRAGYLGDKFRINNADLKAVGAAS